MSPLVKMAWLNVWRNKRRAAILLCAMSIGLIGVILSLGFTRGWLSQMVTTAVRSYEGHVRIMGQGFNDNPVLERSMTPMPDLRRQLNQDPRVAGWTERIAVRGMLSTATHSYGMQIIGIDPASETALSGIRDSIREGTYLSNAAPYKILIGQPLAEKLETRLGKKVVLMAQGYDGEIGSAAFRIGGIFDSGIGSFDENTVYILRNDARDMLSLGDRITETVLMLHNIALAEVVAAELRTTLKGDPVDVLSWQERLPFVVQMINLSRKYTLPYLSIFYLAMAFGISITLSMAISERTHEIGVMMAIGMGRFRLLQLILLESVMLALVAVACGTLVGCGIEGWLAVDGIDLSRVAAGADYSGLGRVLYPELNLRDLTGAGLVTLAVALFFSFLPAARAARMVPVEAIREVR